MLPKGAQLFGAFYLVALSTADVQNVPTRVLVKRSTYDCPPSPPLPPPPPPPAPRPRSFRYPSANNGLHWEQFIQRQNIYNERDLQDQGRYIAQPGVIGYDQNEFENNDSGNRPHCEKYGRKNLAISNAKSDTGDAIALAISKGNSG